MKGLILELDNRITVLKSIAITIVLPAPSVSSELFQILSKGNALRWREPSCCCHPLNCTLMSNSSRQLYLGKN